MHFIKLYIVLIIIICLSCSKKVTDKDTEYVKGIVYETDYSHIGKGNFKRCIHFEYYYNNIKYKSNTTLYFKWQGIYNKGDSIIVILNKENPAICKLHSKIKQTKTIVHKLQSKKD
ncbi:MAG TPA: hypothetical protein DCG75_05075 [Bacteroidales bacterium]|nr:hypothetical protein [Bacteroidales bacterium]